MANVDEYDMEGFVKALPSLQHRRIHHACGVIEQVLFAMDFKLE